MLTPRGDCIGSGETVVGVVLVLINCPSENNNTGGKYLHSFNNHI